MPLAQAKLILGDIPAEHSSCTCEVTDCIYFIGKGIRKAALDPKLLWPLRSCVTCWGRKLLCLLQKDLAAARAPACHSSKCRIPLLWWLPPTLYIAALPTGNKVRFLKVLSCPSQNKFYWNASKENYAGTWTFCRWFPGPNIRSIVLIVLRTSSSLHALAHTWKQNQWFTMLENTRSVFLLSDWCYLRFLGKIVTDWESATFSTDPSTPEKKAK